ncbi:type II toxin-antitoxin system VapC family toxin [Sphingomonas ginsenosidivorax]|uniref:Ribonuclease VapC n=1 Tax=Sphingomonas ginsenosidivorax TaxID=862135 RepID=A0A5C6UFA8_9SPHN|nr:type II toxin-antitoxin system VapC family toxin [Sphingomonas ginsenosidivorax]TXC71100.1 type II toxin-antitoxin system VapC family toxin [Sphingomonas ginsenosidivorax]
MSEPRYLLDSNVLIYLLQGTSERLRHRIETCEPGELVTSAIAYAELMRGVPGGDRSKADAAGRLFGVVAIEPFGPDAAIAYRRVPFRRGRFDRLIAGHALALGLTLVTNNERDFADVDGLRIENWTL